MSGDALDPGGEHGRAETLKASATAREQFAAAVAALPRGRVLPEDFTPRKVVYAILLENSKQLSADTLFPFSQARSPTPLGPCACTASPSR